MVKKIIDVVSTVPKETEGNIAVRIVKSSKPKKGKKTKKKAWKMPKFSFSLNWLFGGLALVLILLIAGIVLSMKTKATLTLYPALSDLAYQDEFEVLTLQEQLDLEKKIIPGKLFETTEEKWGVFKSTGSTAEGGKAEGAVTIYNSQNPPRSFSFVPKTRFVSSKDGKTFKTMDKILVPPAVLVSGKITASSVEAKIQAQDAGEAYNIGPSKFSIPGLSGTAFYYNVWAESKTDMKGGSSSEIKIVTKDDIELAQESLKKELEIQSQEGLQRSLLDGFSFDKDSVSFDSFEPSCFQKEGDQAAEFNCYGKMKSTGLGYKRADLDSLIGNLLKLEIGQGKNYSPESLVVETFSKSTLSKSGSVTLGLKVKAKVYEAIPEQAFVSRIKGENKSNVQNIIKQEYPQINRVEVKVWPFWIRKIPKNLSRIEIKVDISK